MERRLWPAVLFLVVVLVPFVPSPAEAGVCMASPTRAVQDDAGTGADAPDDQAAAVPLPVPPPDANGDLSLYSWGWLDPVASPGADRDDWYSVTLTGLGERVMLSIVASNYTMVPPASGDYHLSIFGPGDISPVGSVTSVGGQIAFDNARAGRFTIHVSMAGSAPCPGPSTVDVGDPGQAMRDYGVYFGCHPFCIAGASRG